MRASVVAALLVSASCITPGAQRPSEEPGVAVTRRRVEPTNAAGHPRLSGKVLPSGMRILVEEDPHATVAAVVSVVRGGSGQDPAGSEGLAHLVEHLTYRAVDPLPAGETPVMRWDKLTRYAVGEMNGFTSPDALTFYEVVPLPRLRALLALAIARLADPLVGVDETAFALERQIIGGEHLVRSDPRAGGWAVTAMFPTLFPAAHPYARPTGGTEESRRKLTLAGARAFAAASFRPERMTLLVTAPPNGISLDALIERLPAALRGDTGHPTKPVESGRPPDDPATATAPERSPPAAVATAGPPRVERRGSPLPTPELWLAWILPGAYSKLGPTIEILQRWVQDDVASQQVTQEAPHIRLATARLQQGQQASVLFVRVLLAEGADPERVAQVVVGRVASLWAREPTAQQTLADLNNLFETNRVLDEPGQMGRALQQALVGALGNRTESTAELLKLVEAVPTSALAKFAYQHLTRERVHAVLFTPTTGAAEIGRSPTSPRALASGTALAELVPGAARWDASELHSFLPPEPEITAAQLATGLTVITARRPGSAAVAWLGFRGGYSDADPPLLVELAMRTRPDAQRAPRLHILPARGATRDVSFEAVEFLPAGLLDALTLLFAKASAPVSEWPAREGLERLLAPTVALEDTQTQKAARAFLRALFGEHPHARTVSANDLGRLTRSDIESWVGRVHNVRNAALVVVGDVRRQEVERAAAILSKQMSTPSWVASLPAPPAPTLRPARGDRLHPVITPRPGSLTDVRIGCLLPPLAPADRGHYELLKNTIEMRLNAALRIDQGDGYGVDVGYERLRGGTTFLVASTFVGEPILMRTLAALRSHWRRWGSDGFEASEINVARWRQAGNLSVSYVNPHAMAFQLLNEWSADPKAVEGERPRADPAGLRAARLNELFATCKANAVLGLTGNEAAIRRALAEAWPSLGPAIRPTDP